MNSPLPRGDGGSGPLSEYPMSATASKAIAASVDFLRSKERFGCEPAVMRRLGTHQSL
jgi:hypothetical protein